MMTQFSPDWLAKIDDVASSFASAEPFRHVVIDGFLRPGLCEALIAEFPPYDDRFRRENGGKAEYPDVNSLGPAFREFDEAVRSPAFLKMAAKITGISGLVHDPRYHGGGAHEIRDGMDNSIHVDFSHLKPSALRRRLNLFVYLNPLWRSEWGGLLQLHSDPLSPGKNVVKSIAPAVNRCVLFETSARSWHGVTRLRLPENERERSRRSIAVYLYAKERASGSAAAAHETVYLNRLLPGRLPEGYSLAAGDIEELSWLDLPARFKPGRRLTRKDGAEIKRLAAFKSQALRLLAEIRRR